MIRGKTELARKRCRTLLPQPRLGDAENTSPRRVFGTEKLQATPQRQPRTGQAPSSAPGSRLTVPRSACSAPGDSSTSSSSPSRIMLDRGTDRRALRGLIYTGCCDKYGCRVAFSTGIRPFAFRTAATSHRETGAWASGLLVTAPCIVEPLARGRKTALDQSSNGVRLAFTPGKETPEASRPATCASGGQAGSRWRRQRLPGRGVHPASPPPPLGSPGCRRLGSGIPGFPHPQTKKQAPPTAPPEK